MKLTLKKKNRKFKKKTISSKAKKRDIYSENAIMPIGKMVGGAVLTLNYTSLPKKYDLQNSMLGAIAKYSKLGNWIDTNGTLKSLKAVDAVKDGAPTGLADTCFDTNIASSTKNPSSLKAFVKTLFENLVESKELKYIQYTRIKNKIFPAPELTGVHYDYYIPDCGPTYSKDNGKTPEVRTSSGGYPEAIYSLGNKLDTGPSSSNSINLHCNSRPYTPYTIDTTTMDVLGYNNLEIEVINTNPIDYKIWFTDISIIAADARNPATKPSNPVIPATIDNYAIGNASKKSSLADESIASGEKKKYLFIKSLGDTLIVYYWLWACRSITDKTISLLTCDSVVALQAFILGHTNVTDTPFLQNAQFALNYTEKGEDHISKVYYKGQPPDYEDLFDSEKKKIIQRYYAEIFNFENNIINDGFTFGENITYTRPELVNAIIIGLRAQIGNINDLIYLDSEDYKKLKGYELTPLIRSKQNDKFVLIRGRNKFSNNDTTFLGLGLHYKPMPLEYLVTKNIFEDDTRGDVKNGGSVSVNTSKIIGGRNDGDEGEYFYRIDPSLDPDEVAIINLQRVINKIYYNILYNYPHHDNKHLNTYLKKLGIISAHTNADKFINPYNNVNEINPYSDYLNTIYHIPFGEKIYYGDYGDSYINTIPIPPGTQIYNYTYGGDSGTLYEILTYHFHVNPDYTSNNIKFLIKEILKEYLPYAREYTERIGRTRSIEKYNSSTRSRTRSRDKYNSITSSTISRSLRRDRDQIHRGRSLSRN